MIHPLSGVNTHGSDGNSMKYVDMMYILSSVAENDFEVLLTRFQELLIKIKGLHVIKNLKCCSSQNFQVTVFNNLQGKSIITIFLIMSAKDSITTQTYELSKEELNDFLTVYPIPSEYYVILLNLIRPFLMLFLGIWSATTCNHGERNFIYTENDEDLSFLPKEPSPGFGTGSPSISSLMPELFVVHPGSVAARIKDMKCKNRGGSSRPPVKRKLALGSSTSRATRAKSSSSKYDAPFLIVSDDDEGLPDVLELKDATACHLKISAITPPAWKNHLDNHIDLELLDLHDRYYERQVVVDNVVNRRSRELLQVIERLRGEFDVIRNREWAREEECEGLRVKCEVAMTEFEKNPTVVALREKIYVLSIEVKEHKLNLDRMMLESQKLVGYQQSLLTLESKVASLEAEKARLEAVKVYLYKEVEELKQDRREVVSKVVLYAVMELVHNDDMGILVGRLVSSAILYRRCRAYEQVADMKVPFDLSKVKGYHSSYKKDHTQASKDFATATFPWLDEFVVDPLAPIEVLFSKKAPSLQRPVPSRSQVPLPASQKATPSSALVSNPMSLPADAFVMKPQLSPLH
ncbi:hypothetical protein Tco_0375379 [Tanacetum coccineum]